MASTSSLPTVELCCGGLTFTTTSDSKASNAETILPPALI
jgi:hypothetical protein